MYDSAVGCVIHVDMHGRENVTVLFATLHDMKEQSQLTLEIDPIKGFVTQLVVLAS